MKRMRGRPAVLSPEEKLRRQRARWQRDKSDRRWQEQSAGGYVELIEIMHWRCFLEVLVDDDWIYEEDVHVAAYVSEAVDELLANANFRDHHGNGYNRRRRTLNDVRGTVKIRITPELITAFVQWEYRRAEGKWSDDVPQEFAERVRGDRRAVRIWVEDYLRRFYLTHVPNPPKMPCVCRAKMPWCDCHHRRRSRQVVGQIHTRMSPVEPDD
jgi:hypothetical protein